MRWQSLAVGVFSTLLAVANESGCEFVNSRSGLQCATTTDCRSKGGAFSTAICSREGICVAINAADASVANGACASSGDCAFSLGGAARCVNGACVALTTADGACTAAGPTSDDSAIFFAALVPRGGEVGAQNAKLDAVVGGLLDDWNGVSAQPTPPHAAAVICDEANLGEALGLISASQAQFIVGPFTEAALSSVLPQTSLPVFSPMGDSSTYATPSSNLRTWFCSPNRSKLVSPFQDAVQKITSSVATARSETNVKVVFAHNSRQPDEEAFIAAVRPNLRFNGALASDQPTYYSEEDVNLDLFTNPVVITQAVQLVSAKPDVILMTSSLWARLLIDTIEQRWGAQNPGVPRPVYLMVRHNLAVAAEVAATSATIDYTSRVYSLDAHLDSLESTNSAVLNGRLRDLIAQSPPEGSPEYNDCMYAAILSSTAASVRNSVPAPNVSILQLAQGVGFVSSGTSANEGNLVPSDFPRLLGLINESIPTLLVGTSEYLGFDPTTGIPSPAIDLFCIGSNGGPSPQQWTSAGVQYDAQTQTPSGALACP